MRTWIIYWLGIKIPQALAVSGGNQPPGSSGGLEIQNPLGCDEATECVSGILNGLIFLAAPVVAIMILVGGFQIMASGGNEEKLKSGKNTITYAIVGYAIILLAKGVASIIRSVVGAGP